MEIIKKLLELDFMKIAIPIAIGSSIGCCIPYIIGMILGFIGEKTGK